MLVPAATNDPDTMDRTILEMRSNSAEEDKSASPQKRQRTDGNTAVFCAVSYWPYSPEAYQLFRPRRGGSSGVGSYRDNMASAESPKEAVERRNKQLQSVHKTEDSWRNVVIVGRDADNYCTKAKVFEIRQRATFLCRAYQLALTHMNSWTWYKCCQEACNELNCLGMMQGTCYKTVARSWHKTFRQFECFLHRNPYVQCGKRPMPRLLEVFPDAKKDQIISYAVKNLAKLTIQGVHDFIVSKVLPRLVIIWQKDVVAVSSATEEHHHQHNNNMVSVVEDDDKILHAFLNAHRLASLSLTTAWRWMRLLGFHYDSRKKRFYLDGHECEDVVANCTLFCKQYLTEYEPCSRQWVQVSGDEAAAIKDLDAGFGYH